MGHLQKVPEATWRECSLGSTPVRNALPGPVLTNLEHRGSGELAGLAPALGCSALSVCLSASCVNGVL